MLYELCITFSQELELFWNGKITGATFLFLANRYLTVVVQVCSLATSFLPSSAFSAKVCPKPTELAISKIYLCLLRGEPFHNAASLHGQPELLV